MEVGAGWIASAHPKDALAVGTILSAKRRVQKAEHAAGYGMTNVKVV